MASPGHESRDGSLECAPTEEVGVIGRTTQETRQLAIDLLTERGWAADGFEEEGPLSADMAIALASGETDTGWPEKGGPYLTTMSELESILGRGSLLDWEMQPGRTAEDVVNLLRSGDVAGGAYPPYSPEEQEQRRLAYERSLAAIERQGDVLRQMVARSGPIYELARERSRTISEAYRAAGRPPDVTPARTSDGSTYVIKVGQGRQTRYESATEDEWRAWESWRRERERLRQGYGMGRHARPPGRSAIADDP